MTIKVLVIDDSALIRQVMTELLSRDPGITVVGTAPDPIIARDKIRQLAPDVLTLDIEMPRMDGLSFLERLMTVRPMPVLVVSSLTQRGTDTALRALELGAIDYVPKPLADIRDGMVALGRMLVEKVKAAAVSRPRPRQAASLAPVPLQVDAAHSTAGDIIAIGASLGGVEALHRFMAQVPAGAPAMLVTQHMPPGFTATFAKRLDERCAMAVLEATDGRRVLPGHAYIAPGARHLELARDGAHYVCRVHDGPRVSDHKPSVDALFHSVARAARTRATGVILTGMGRDGAEGLLAMRRGGARTFGQSEASCVVYGMPKAAMELGAVETEAPLERLPALVLQAQQGAALAPALRQAG